MRSSFDAFDVSELNISRGAVGELGRYKRFATRARMCQKFINALLLGVRANATSLFIFPQLSLEKGRRNEFFDSSMFVHGFVFVLLCVS